MVWNRRSIHRNVKIGNNVTLGAKREARLKGHLAGRREPSIIEAGCMIQNNVVIYEGSIVRRDTFVDDGVRVGYGCDIGARVRLMYRAFICDRVTVGNDSRVAGFVCDGSSIGPQATSMGNLVHRYEDPSADWWGPDEEAPTVEAFAVIGYGATVVGGVRIGANSYVGAGAIVTKNVPPDSVVVGVNQIYSRKAWEGDALGT